MDDNSNDNVELPVQDNSALRDILNDNDNLIDEAESNIDEKEEIEGENEGNEHNNLLSLFEGKELDILLSLPQGQILEILGNVNRGMVLSEAMKQIAIEEVKNYESTVKNQYAEVSVSEAASLNVESHLETDDSGVVFMGDNFSDIAAWTPIRLNHSEREYLRLVEGALNVSEYTDRVDILAGNKTQRIIREIKQCCKVLSGLLVAHDYAEGSKVLESKDFKAQADIYTTLFEIPRRYKVLNPEKLRDAYGKCIYLLMDAAKPELAEMLGFNLIRPIATVKDVIELHEIENMLRDPRLKFATMEILHEGRRRGDVQRDIEIKNRYIKELAEEYSNYVAPHRRGGLAGLKLRTTAFLFGSHGDEDDELDMQTKNKLTKDGVEQIIFSLTDHHSHIRNSVYPIQSLQAYLNQYFKADGPTNDHDVLRIRVGLAGSRLSHDHNRQFKYVEQTLVFWKVILKNFYKLWSLAEHDLLSERGYTLRDTGQGLNRVQGAPLVSATVSKIVMAVKNEMGYWIGSDMVHLGDHSVPNALVFIDKYTQVPRIVQPLINILDRIPQLYQGSLGQQLEEKFGSVDVIRTIILADFFRHGFDGSGADNFYDAGSCIDGRLTSAWNWCSLIHKKNYYPIFQLLDFQGFDGSFR